MDRKWVITRSGRILSSMLHTCAQLKYSSWKLPHTFDTLQWRYRCSLSIGKVTVAVQLSFDWTYSSGEGVNFRLFKYCKSSHSILQAPKEKSYKPIYKVWRDSMEKWESYEFSKNLLKMLLQISAWKGYVKKTVIALRLPKRVILPKHLNIVNVW